MTAIDFVGLYAAFVICLCFAIWIRAVLKQGDE